MSDDLSISAAYDPETLEGLQGILAAALEISPLLGSKATYSAGVRRLVALGDAVGCDWGLTAAINRPGTSWDPLLHPRGPDGRFIETAGWVRWFDFLKRKWFRGKVHAIEENGDILVHRSIGNGVDEFVEHRFSHDEASRQLYAQPKPKATIDFPEVTTPGDNNGWKQESGAGGSNPGGTYVLDKQEGVQAHEWTEEELEFLLDGRPGVEVVGFVDDKDQFDDENFSDRLKGKLHEKYGGLIQNAEGDEVAGDGTAGVWEDIPGGRRSAGGVIVWDDPEDGTQVAVVNRHHHDEQGPTPEGKWRADFALQNWVFRRIKAKLLPQNPERKLHPSWRRIVYGVGPDTGLGLGGPSGLNLPRINLPDFGQEAEGIAQSASQAVQTASEIRNAANGALVSLEDIVRADPSAVLYPFEIDFDPIPGVGGQDRLEALVNYFMEPAIQPGDRFYVKDLSFGETGADRVANEVLANRLYELAGVAVPDVYQGNDPQKIGSRMIGGELVDVAEKLDDPEVMARVRENFTVDAWLANWDVAGLEFDNIVVDEDGIPYRIDAGGALAYRGMGSPKGDMFGPVVGELQTMAPGPEGRGESAEMFAGLTDEEIAHGAQRIAGISPEEIRELGRETGVDQHVVDTLIARRTDIIDKILAGDDPFSGRPETEVPEIVEEAPEAAVVEGRPKADLDDLRDQVAETEIYVNPALEDLTAPPPSPADNLNPEEFPPALRWEEAGSWSGESQQWVASGEPGVEPTEEVLEEQWRSKVDEVSAYIATLEAEGVVAQTMPASQLAGSGVLDNPKGIVLMTDTYATAGGRTDMFVPWGTDADGNTVLVSRISGQTVTPAVDWADTRAQVRTLDLSPIEAEDFDDELDWIDGLTTVAAEAQVSLEAVRTPYAKLADVPALGWKRGEDIGNDPADIYLLEGEPVLLERMTDGGATFNNVLTGEPVGVATADQLSRAGLDEPDQLFRGITIVDDAGVEQQLLLPDMTGQQVVRARIEMEKLQQRSDVAAAAMITDAFPQEFWVKPIPDLGLPDKSVELESTKPVPTGDLAGPTTPDDWDYQADLVPGSYIDTSQPSVVFPTDTERPQLPASVPIITSVDFGEVDDSLVGQWVMHDVQDFRFTRQPALVEEVMRDLDGNVGIAVTHPDGSKSILAGPDRSRVHVVEPPKEGRNVPALDTAIVLGHNGDIRIGKEVIGQWWHVDRNVSHRHTYGYLIESQYTAHGKSTIGFRKKAKDVRNQVRSEVWFADNYEPIEPESIEKVPTAKALEEQVKTAPPAGLLKGGKTWQPGQAVNKRLDWDSEAPQSEGVIVGGVHPDRSDIVYYKDHTTGHITLEDVNELTAHGEPPEDPKKVGGLFELEGDTWYIQQVAGDEVIAYSVTEGHQEIFEVSELPPSTEPTPFGPISTYEGTFVAGALSSQEAKDEWAAVGGTLLADGEIPLPGTQLVDGSGQLWRVVEAGPGDLVVINGPQIEVRPASEFRVDRAHFGGAVGVVGAVELASDEGPVDYVPQLGDVFYVDPSHSWFRVLTATGELRSFSMNDGYESVVLNSTEHGSTIQDRLSSAHRVGVYQPDSTTSLVIGYGEEYSVRSASVDGSLTEAKKGFVGIDKGAKVLEYQQDSITTVNDPGAEEVGIELPTGAEETPDLAPVLSVDPDDIEWHDGPGGVAPVVLGEGAQPPSITGAGMADGTVDGKTFMTSENTKTIEEAIEKAWAAAESGDGKTVTMVQFDHDAVEDFVLQIMPVRDTSTQPPTEYVEVFFRPLEGHAHDLYDQLVAPIDQTNGEWFPVDATKYGLGPNLLEVGSIIAVRRGPNGQLMSWNGHETQFGTAEVVSAPRVIGHDGGVPIHEVDVMLPNGKLVTITQQTTWETYVPLEWRVHTDQGALTPEELRAQSGGRRPSKLSTEATQAGWRMLHLGLGSQVQHGRDGHFSSAGVKEIDTDAAYSAGSTFNEDPGMTIQRRLGDGTKVWVSLQAPPVGKQTKEQNNFGRQVFIQIPRNQADGTQRSTEEFARALSAGMEAVGVTPEQQTLPTNEALEAWAINAIGQSFGANPQFLRDLESARTPSVGPLQPGRKWTRTEVEELLANEVSSKIGRPVSFDDFEFAVDPDGRLMVVTSEQLARDLSAAAGYISHRHETLDYWTDPQYGARNIVDKIARTLGFGKGPDNIGPAGRAAIGIWSGGQSSDVDMMNGTGNRFYAWTHDSDPPQVRTGPGFDIVWDDEIFQRFLGNGMSSGDNYGKRAEQDKYAYEHPLAPWWSSHLESTDHNESTMKYGIDGSLIEVITVQDAAHPYLIEELRQLGITEVNGRPIEDIVIPASQMISMKERRKARQARPNGGFFPIVGRVSDVLDGAPQTPQPELAVETPAPQGMSLEEFMATSKSAAQVTEAVEEVGETVGAVP